jgi:hypothetical protein
LVPCDRERRSRWVHAGHGKAAASKQAGEGPGAAADVKDTARPELLDHGLIGVQVTAIGVERVVDLGKTRLFEDRIGHTKDNRPDPPSSAALTFRR